MTHVTIEFDPTNQKEVYGAVRAACGTLKTFGNYTVSLVPNPSGTAVDQPGTPAVETPAPETPATEEIPATTDEATAEQAAPDAPADPAAPGEQVAPDAAAPAETPADQQPQQ